MWAGEARPHLLFPSLLQNRRVREGLRKPIMEANHRFNEVLLEWVDISKRRSMRDFTRWMNECGLSRSQIGALMRLYYHGDCPVSGLGDDLNITTAAASQLVDRLVQMQLLERTERPDDRRVRHISLSEAGRSLIEEGVEARLGWMRDLADVLNDRQQSEIILALETLIEAVKAREAVEAGAR